MPQFEIANKEAEKWTMETVGAKLTEMLSNAESDDQILCLQDAIRSVGLYRSSLDYLIDKFPVFGNIKRDVNESITARINKGALNGDYNVTAAIWRMKQQGESDQQNINHQNNGGSFSIRELYNAETQEEVE